jgi:hypothetical protein
MWLIENHRPHPALLKQSWTSKDSTHAPQGSSNCLSAVVVGGPDRDIIG